MTDSVKKLYAELTPFYHLIYSNWNQSVERHASMLDAIIHENWGKNIKSILNAACGVMRRTCFVSKGDAGKIKHEILMLVFISFLTGCETAAPPPNNEEIWPLVAKSHLIVTGTLSVPVASIQSRLASEKHDYVEVAVKPEQVLKGSPPPTFHVRWYTRPANYSPQSERVISFDGKKALLFLVDVDEPPGLYFAGRTPRALSEPKADFIEKIKREVTTQQNILADFSRLFPPEEEPNYHEVKELIDATMKKDTQMDAFRRLEELGQKGVPAIIMLMDDRRDLAVRQITLQNPSGHWEAVRHYSPAKVVDAMEAILNQITGHAFGNVCSGGTEEARRKAVNGWKIYLYYFKKGSPKK